VTTCSSPAWTCFAGSFAAAAAEEEEDMGAFPCFLEDFLADLPLSPPGGGGGIDSFTGFLLSLDCCRPLEALPFEALEAVEYTSVLFCSGGCCSSVIADILRLFFGKLN
jgi:hypothetical protein